MSVLSCNYAKSNYVWEKALTPEEVKVYEFTFSLRSMFLNLRRQYMLALSMRCWEVPTSASLGRSTHENSQLTTFPFCQSGMARLRFIKYPSFIIWALRGGNTHTSSKHMHL